MVISLSKEKSEHEISINESGAKAMSRTILKESVLIYTKSKDFFFGYKNLRILMICIDSNFLNIYCAKTKLVTCSQTH